MNSLLEYLLEDVLVCIYKSIVNKADDKYITLTCYSLTGSQPKMLLVSQLTENNKMLQNHVNPQVLRMSTLEPL